MRARSRSLLVVLIAVAVCLPSGGAAGVSSGPVEEALRGDVLEQVGAGPDTVLVVHERGADPGTVGQGLESLGVPFTMLERVGVTQALVTEQDLAPVASLDGVQAVYPDEAVTFQLDEAAPLVKAPGAWEDHGATGEGSTVLVIDTGLDATHPDLSERVVENAQPHDPLETGLVPAGYTQGVPANDAVGHGTHVAGIVAGTGQGVAEADPSHGTYVGIAPGADLVGWAIPGVGDASNVFQAVQGFEYALEHQDRFGIDVITNSWAITGEPDPEHPVSVATLEAYKAGMSVVFSAGNDGAPEEGAEDDVRLNMFGGLPWAISVSAVDSQGALAGFSSQGTAPESVEDVWEHPDVAAQGVSVMAAKSRMGGMQALGPTYADAGAWDPVGMGTHYQYASGTSMSGPAIAGVLALVHGANPELSPAQAYEILVETVQPLEDSYWEAGVGLADAERAVEAALMVEGDRQAFLEADEVPFTDLQDPLDHPVRGFLADEASDRSDAQVLLEALGAEATVNGSDALDELSSGSLFEAPGAGALAALSALLAALMVAGRRA